MKFCWWLTFARTESPLRPTCLHSKIPLFTDKQLNCDVWHCLTATCGTTGSNRCSGFTFCEGSLFLSRLLAVFLCRENYMRELALLQMASKTSEECSGLTDGQESKCSGENSCFEEPCILFISSIFDKNLASHENERYAWIRNSIVEAGASWASKRKRKSHFNLFLNKSIEEFVWRIWFTFPVSKLSGIWPHNFPSCLFELCSNLLFSHCVASQFCCFPQNQNDAHIYFALKYSAKWPPELRMAYNLTKSMLAVAVPTQQDQHQQPLVLNISWLLYPT